jgi:ADP-ribose pyrophosphatase YjhB (NUDIX family)
VGFFGIMVETLKQAESPQKVVRAFVVSLASSEEILNSLNKEGFSILRFYLGVKGKNDETSDSKERRRLTFFGGKVGKNENLREAIQREVSEELSIWGLGLLKFTQIGSWVYEIGDQSPREAVLTYLPINNYLKEKGVVIGDNKIDGFVVLSLKQLREAIETGMIDGLPLEEHLTLAKDSYGVFSISNEEKDRRDKALRRGLSWMEHIENYLRRKVNYLIDLCTDENGKFNEEMFKKEYEKLRSYFMRRGLEVNKKGRNEKKEEAKKHPLVEVLTSGFLGKEILYYLPELAINGVVWSGLEEAPEGVRIFIDFLKGTLEEFLKRPVNLSSGEQITFSSIDEYKDFLISGKIVDVNWVINQFDGFLKGKLKEIFGVSDEQIFISFNWLDNFFRDLSNELKVADPNLLKGLYQDFIFINEVKNANLGYLTHLFFGIDIKDNKSATNIIRFEAGRSILLLMKFFSFINYYQRQTEKIRNGLAQNVINSFFGHIIDEEIVEVGESQKLRVRIRQRANGDIFIVDEKPIKSPTSFLRKSFEEKLGEIRDFYTVSVVMLNGNGAESLISELIDYLKEQQIKYIISDKKDYGTKNYESGEKGEASGKRVGSQGSRFVRTKFILELINLFGYPEYVEIIIYPYYSINNGYHWGWLETRKDDKDYVVRRVLAGENGMPSFYDLLFPPVLYSRHYEHRLNSAYHK